eukprot:4101692-Amphidinium_carterae.1
MAHIESMVLHEKWPLAVGFRPETIAQVHTMLFAPMDCVMVVGLCKEVESTASSPDSSSSIDEEDNASQSK